MAAGSACDHFTFSSDDREVARYGLGAAALRYARLGYAVIPLARGGKRPHAMLGDRGGIHHASRDETQVGAWWLMDPAANIGVATGAVNRLMVIDLDVKGGKNGKQAFWDFLNHGLVTGGMGSLPWPDPPYAVTPSGGVHLWLRSSGSVSERPGILNGVDVKGDGGLVVAPPSMALKFIGDRSGGTSGEVPVPYEWVSGCPHEIPQAPDWAARWLLSAPSGAREGSSREDSQGDGIPLDTYRKEGVPAGSRNREIYRIACSLFRKEGTTPGGAERVRSAVREVWEKTDKRDFSWHEVLVCVESARRFVESAVERERLPQAQMESFAAWLDSSRRGSR